MLIRGAHARRRSRAGAPRRRPAARGSRRSRWKTAQHVVQPRAVVALLDLVVELVELGQTQARARRRSGTGRRAGPRTRSPRDAAGNACAGTVGAARAHRLGGQAPLAARIVPGAQIARRAVRRAHLGQRRAKALDERARRDRIAGVAAAPQDRHARQAQQLGEGEQLAVAAVGRRRQRKRLDRAARQERIVDRHRAERAMIGAGHDDGGERAQHRSRERRDDDVGQGRRRLAGVFVRSRRGRRAVGDALEDIVGPAREFGQRQRSTPSASAARRAGASGGSRPSAASAWRPASSSSSCAEHAPALEGVVDDVEPCRQRASRRCPRSHRAWPSLPHAGVPRRPAASRARGRRGARRAGAGRSLRARRASRPRASPAGGKDLSQSRYASALAVGRAACKSDITLAPARVVDIFQPVSSAMRAAARSSSARTRRTRTRSCATSATGRSSRPRWSSTWAAAAQASSSKPSQRAARAARQRARARVRRRARSSGTSVSTTSAGASPSASSARASASGPPAWIAIHAEGRSANRRSVDDDVARVGGPLDGDPCELLLAAGGAAEAAVERLARRLPPCVARRRSDRRRGTSELVRRRRDARGRVLETTPIATQPLGAPALAAEQLGCDDRVEGGVEAALAIGRVRRTERSRPGCASSRSAASRCPGVRRRAAPARAARRKAPAPLHRATSTVALRAHAAQSAAMRSQRASAGLSGRATRASGKPPCVTRAIVFIGSRWGRAASARGPLCQNDCACRRTLALGVPGPTSPPQARGSRHEQRADHPHLRRVVQRRRHRKPARRCWSTTGPNGAGRAR